jgi:hypothetical protein
MGSDELAEFSRRVGDAIGRAVAERRSSIAAMRATCSPVASGSVVFTRLSAEAKTPSATTSASAPANARRADEH